MSGRVLGYFVAGVAAALLAVAPAALAQESSTPALTLELNGLQPSEKGCRLTFVIANDLGGDLTRAAFEIVLFDDAGAVDRLMVLDFNELPAGKTKVSRFNLAGVDCAKIGRVLINSLAECNGRSVDTDACMKGLKTSNRTSITFGL